jgi:hypothetical protein
VNENKPVSENKNAWITADDHAWLRRQAFERETTITAELTAAIALLRQQRTAAAARQERKQASSAVSA